MSPPAPKDDPEAAVERTFLVDLADATDAVVRVLEVFTLVGAPLSGLDFKPRGETSGARLKVAAVGLDAARAERIHRRLAVMPSVRAVAFGWRT